MKSSYRNELNIMLNNKGLEVVKRDNLGQIEFAVIDLNVKPTDSVLGVFDFESQVVKWVRDN